jgi:hypothetical protein
MVLQDLARDTGARIAYAGREEKRAFALCLAKCSGVSQRVIDAALFGFRNGAITTGANRNAILLRTTGSLFLSVDDDTICHTAQVRTRAGKFTYSLRGHDDPQDIWVFANRQSALDALSFVRQDISACHERVLGKSLAAVLAYASSGEERLDMDGICPDLLEMLFFGKGRIVLTFAPKAKAEGCAGLVGTGGPINTGSVCSLEAFVWTGPNAGSRMN